MRKFASFAVLALLVLVALSLWTEKRTHPKGMSPAPVATHGGNTIEYRYGPVRLSFAASLATAAHGADLPATTFVADEIPDGVGPAHVEISFDGFAGTSPRASVEATVDVYPVADFDNPEFGSPEQNLPLKELTLLRERLAEPAGRGSSNQAIAGFMPYMPVAADAGQVFAAKVVALTGRGVTGIRYLTAYSQEAAPLLEGQIFYTFQGLTIDRRYYVAASFPLQSGFLPAAFPEGFDAAHFEREIGAYQHETVNILEARPAAQFTPSLKLLDAIVESIIVDTH
jgi:hypothetical protein